MNFIEQEIIACCQDHRVTDKGKEELDASGAFTFPRSFTGFQGHFPGRPVLPAVMQLIMIRLLAEQTLTLKLAPRKYGKTKFRRVILPDQNILTKITLTSDNEGVHCQYFIEQPDGPMISEGSCFFSIVR